ncbi:hypothetical protein ACIQU5_06405 [Streptomyces sp. NPDC090306]|uniref:hypothetical protein n=1 Tax=unclassified Streptomyces TaxID=2593676 RepID=UPI0036E6F078
MTDPLTLLALQRLHSADLRRRADTHRTAREHRRPRELRTRLGWRLVEVGLRLAATPRSGVAVAR